MVVKSRQSNNIRRWTMPHKVSDPIIRTVPQPADMNGNGDIFGGWVLSQMDMAGGNLAGRVAKVGRTSITIDLETIVQRRDDAAEIRVTHGTFVFVAIDEHGKPRAVP